MADINAVGGSYKYPDATSDLKVSKSNSSLGLDDFMYLLAAQMSNQDMMNPMDDSDFIAQLAQFSSLEAMQQLTQLTTTSYSASLLGKEVTVAQLLSTGELKVTVGTVTGVGLFNNEPVIYLDNEPVAYLLNEVMAVGTVPEAPEEPDEGDGDTGETEGG